jgi:hypothetical protein
MCARCYFAQKRGQAKDDRCACCGNADARVLVRRRLVDSAGYDTLCANCSTILGRRSMTLPALALEVRPVHDRRQNDRRGGKERRTEQRRTGSSPPPASERRTSRPRRQTDPGPEALPAQSSTNQ